MKKINSKQKLENDYINNILKKLSKKDRSLLENNLNTLYKDYGYLFKKIKSNPELFECYKELVLAGESYYIIENEIVKKINNNRQIRTNSQKRPIILFILLFIFPPFGAIITVIFSFILLQQKNQDKTILLGNIIFAFGYILVYSIIFLI